MIMRDGGKIGSCGVKPHGDDDFMDEFGCVRTDNGSTENLPAAGMSDEFDEPAGLSHDEGFSVIVERVFCGAERDSSGGEFLLAGSDRGEPGLGENGEEFQPVVHHFHGLLTGGKKF